MLSRTLPVLRAVSVAAASKSGYAQYCNPGRVQLVALTNTKFIRQYCSSSSNNAEGKANRFQGSTEDKKSVQLPLEGRFMIQFTCKVCNQRQSKSFAKKSYYTGVVIIRCDGCRNLHLIADNLGWFKDVKRWTIEDILRERGETVQKLIVGESGTLEINLPQAHTDGGTPHGALEKKANSTDDQPPSNVKG